MNVDVIADDRTGVELSDSWAETLDRLKAFVLPASTTGSSRPTSPTTTFTRNGAKVRTGQRSRAKDVEAVGRMSSPRRR